MKVTELLDCSIELNNVKIQKTLLNDETIRMNCITSTLCVIHCSSGDRGSPTRTHQALSGTVTRLVVTEWARLTDLQPVQGVTARFTLT